MWFAKNLIYHKSKTFRHAFKKNISKLNPDESNEISFLRTFTSIDVVNNIYFYAN